MPFPSARPRLPPPAIARAALARAFPSMAAGVAGLLPPPRPDHPAKRPDHSEPASRAARRPPPAALPDLPRAGSSGVVCRDPRLLGRERDAILHPQKACGIAAPVELHEVAGLRLSLPAVIDCTTARRLADWVAGIVAPAARAHLGTRVTGLGVMGAYACRGRNNLAGARISEHGRGRAIDIGAIHLADGRVLTLARDWGRGAAGRFLEAVRKGACGPFATVLGPGSDRWHHDHLHLDTAPRASRWCR